MKKTERLYGEWVVDFANAENNDEAFSGYLRNLDRAFGHDLEPDLRLSELSDTFDELKKDLQDFVEKMRTDLSDMLELIVCGDPLKKNAVFKNILMEYNAVIEEFRITLIKLKDDDSIVEIRVPRLVGYEKSVDPAFEEHPIVVENFKKMMRQDLAHCTIEFFRVKKNREYINKCDQCQKYFIATRLNNQRFCDKSCRMKYHHSKPEYKEKKATKQREKYGWEKSVNAK